jgi:type II secretory pathway pseudopilin PulG
MKRTSPRFRHSVIRSFGFDSSFEFRHSNFQRKRAFTLIELLLALALTVTVVTLLTNAMFTAFRAKSSINNALDSARLGDPTTLLVRELENALPPTPSASTNLANVIGLGPSAISAEPTSVLGPFYGFPDQIDFYTAGAEPKADLQPDVRHVQYALVSENNGKKSLVRRVSTNLLASGEIVFDPDEILVTNVTSLTFQYYDGTNAFEQNWDSTAKNNALPYVVQFTLELPAPTPTDPNKTRRLTHTIPLPCAQPSDSANTGVTQ